jgi:ABC-type branched-subunit amino acid transport system substrate-binding protein
MTPQGLRSWLLILLLGLSACGERRTHQIGVSVPLTGDLRSDGTKLLQAMKLRVQEINEAGGVKGVPLELVVRDDAGDPARAKSIAREFAGRKQLVAVVGPVATSAYLEALPLYHQAKIPVISPIEASPRASKLSPYAFSMTYSYTAQAEFMAVYLREILQRDNVLVIHPTGVFGEQSREVFTAKATRLGMKVAKALPYDTVKHFGDDFVKQGLSAEEKAQIGAVVIFSRAKLGVRLVRQIREAGMKALILGPSYYISERFLELPTWMTQDVYVASPFLYELASKKALRFQRQYQRRYQGKPNTRTPFGHDAITLIARGLEGQAPSREKLRAFLSGLTWQTAVEGITGPLFFKPDRTADRDEVVCQIKDGRWQVGFRQLIEPREPYVLEAVRRGQSPGNIKIIDGQPYHQTDVVMVGLDFLRISDVDTRTTQFEAEIILWLKWMSPRLNPDDIDIFNLVSRKDRILLKEDLRRSVKYRAYRQKAVFDAPMNLEAFPFDRQTLPITIGHRNQPATSTMIVVDARHQDDAPITKIAPPEWEYRGRSASAGLFRHATTFGDPDYRQGRSYKAKVYFSTMNVEVKVKRLVFPYLFNLFLPLFIILGISCLVLALPVDHSQRIGANMTALLSVLVYYLSQKSTLPKVGYLMKVDWYFIASFLFVLALMVVNVVIVWFLATPERKPMAAKLNHWFAIICVPLLLIVFTVVTVFG